MFVYCTLCLLVCLNCLFVFLTFRYHLCRMFTVDFMSKWPCWATVTSKWQRRSIQISSRMKSPSPTFGKKNSCKSIHIFAWGCTQTKRQTNRPDIKLLLTYLLTWTKLQANKHRQTKSIPRRGEVKIRIFVLWSAAMRAYRASDVGVRVLRDAWSCIRRWLAAATSPCRDETAFPEARPSPRPPAVPALPAAAAGHDRAPCPRH